MVDVIQHLALVVAATLAGGLLGTGLLGLTLAAGAFIVGHDLLSEWLGGEA